MDNQCFIFQFSGGTASRMVADAKPENFDDMICLNAYSRPGASFGFGNFCLIKNDGQKSVYPEQIQQFLKDGRGTICFQEQVMAIGNYLTDGKYNGDTCHINNKYRTGCCSPEESAGTFPRGALPAFLHRFIIFKKRLDTQNTFDKIYLHQTQRRLLPWTTTTARQ